MSWSPVTTAGVVVLGVLLGIAGNITLGELLAFLFLIALFVGPVQVGTEVLNEAQNAVSVGVACSASWTP